MFDVLFYQALNRSIHICFTRVYLLGVIFVYIYIYTYTLTLRIAYMHIIVTIYTHVHLHVFYAITYIVLEIYNLCACANAQVSQLLPAKHNSSSAGTSNATLAQPLQHDFARRHTK